MDVKIFENANCISAIYKDSIPKFQDIEIVKLMFFQVKMLSSYYL